MNSPYIVTFFLIITEMFLCTIPAEAHDSRPIFVQIKESNSGAIRLSWKTPPSIDVGQAPALSLSQSCRMVHDRKESSSLNKVTSYLCSDGLAGAQLNINYPLYNPSLSTFVRIEYATGEIQNTILNPAISNWTIPSHESFPSVANSYFQVGIRHILGGLDHLLFLAGLLYIARTPKRVIITVTGFTIAHSITIFLVALNFISLSVPAVETIIALSILYLASEAARSNRDTLTWRHPIYVAAGFGLVHGAGFAAALTEIGLPQTQKISALVFFNLGVEAGQLAIFLMAFILAWLITKLTQFQLRKIDDAPLRYILSYSLGIISAFWFIERLIKAIT